MYPGKYGHAQPHNPCATLGTHHPRIPLPQLGARQRTAMHKSSKQPPHNLPHSPPTVVLPEVFAEVIFDRINIYLGRHV